MNTDIDIIVTRDEDEIEILVDASRSDSLYEFLRAHGYAPTFPKDAIWTAVGMRRLPDGRVVRHYEAAVRELALIDTKKTIEKVVEEWLSTQK